MRTGGGQLGIKRNQCVLAKGRCLKQLRWPRILLKFGDRKESRVIRLLRLSSLGHLDSVACRFLVTIDETALSIREEYEVFHLALTIGEIPCPRNGCGHLLLVGP